MNFWGAERRNRWIVLLINATLCAVFAGPMLTLASQAVSIAPTTVDETTATELVAANPTAAVALTKNVQRTVLDNGLTILTKEVHNAPVVTVQVWYKIGSRNEAPGVNGIAHQLEHMLFKGTKSRPVQFGRLFGALGSSFNAFTSYDQTAYHETLERNKMKSAMVLEADRMQNGLIDSKLLEGEKRVVISEIQGNENSANYRLGKAVQELALPDSPYGLSVIGTKADIKNFTVAQVRSYYDSYYAPNNAVLVLVGDFDTATALQDAKETFGQVPRREITVKAPVAAKRVVKSRQITLREPGSTALLNAVYPLPNVVHPDVPAIDVMNYILSVGRSSRLYQKLVETGAASSVGASAANLADGGWYEYSAAADPGKSMAKIDQMIQQEIATIQKKAASPVEIDRAKTQLRAGYLLGYRSIDSQASQLGNDETSAGDYRFTDKYLNNVAKVTAADVQRVAKKYLQPSKRVVGFFVPDNSKGQPVSSGGSEHNAAANLGKPLDPTELQKYLPKVIADKQTSTQNLPKTIKLSNGLKVLLLPDTSSPTVTIGGNIIAGTEYDVAGKEGVAGLTAANLINGTTSKNALAIATALESRGANLAFGASREGAGLGGSALDQDLPILLSTLGDVLQNATFPAKEFNNSRQRALTGLQAELDNPASVARRKFQQAIYPQGHPFTNFATIQSLKSITQQDLQNFYRQNYQPQNTILALVGNFEVEKATQLLEKSLGSWKNQGQLNTLTYVKPELPKKSVQFNPTLVGKTQSVTIMGNKAINRKDPSYYAALVLNQVVGGDTLSSRLGTEIRDRLGLTYGISSGFAVGKQQGTFQVTMQTAPEDAARAIDNTLKLLREVKDQGLTAAEVENAKGSIASNYTVELGSPDDVAGTTLNNVVQGLPEDEIREFPNKIRAVTPAQVNQVAKDLLHPDQFVIVTVGPPLTSNQSEKPGAKPKGQSKPADVLQPKTGDGGQL
jgi:zinc protease